MLVQLSVEKTVMLTSYIELFCFVSVVVTFLVNKQVELAEHFFFCKLLYLHTLEV